MAESNHKKKHASEWEWTHRKEKADATLRSSPLRSTSEGSGRRKRSLIESCVGFSIGLFIFFRHSHIAGAIIFCIAGLAFTGGWFYPPLYEVFRKLGVQLARIVGVALSWILLVPFFYMCFTIGRIIQMASGKDPLARKFPSNEKSYWAPRKRVENIDHYKRQY